nr:glycosyltransferase WbuB [Rhizobium sp. Q54]
MRLIGGDLTELESNAAVPQTDRLRVLIVSQHYWPESFRINEVVQSLIGCSAEVDVLTGQPNYPKGEIYPGYSAFGCGRELHPSGYSIFRVPVVTRGRGGALRRVLNYLSFVASGCLIAPWLLRGRRYDVILVYAISPILQAIPAILIKRIKTASLVIWVQDLWPDSLEATGYVRNSIALAAVSAVTRGIYRRADLILGQSRGFVRKIREMAGPAAWVEYHPNPGDLTFVANPLERVAPVDLDPSYFNIVFAGNLGAAQSLETIVAAAQLLRDPSIKITIVGEGSRADWLRQEIERRKIDNIKMTGSFPADLMPVIYNQASALLVTLASSPDLDLTVPSKVSSYLAAGRPIIGALNGESANVIRDAEAGLVVPAEDAEALASAMITIRQLPAGRREIMSHAGRSYFERHFAPKPLAHKLMQYMNCSRVTCADRSNNQPQDGS